ncbi:DUF305 domain-containing protein [Thermostaphylospora chromogena]|uniref:Uncharacterized conserved protein, DUF305 family n=1 Tax=Thermostaphylospora chromogena TaxID=35622 RepID=A0A1H1G074_9ACTN|nr:DUF305 domain-containing protein [Thermostaphylospora chromogena]SDR06627.1 Uncharacterized conserved protein, DUF305 family [Thermostaphylospora chromogena]
METPEKTPRNSRGRFAVIGVFLLVAAAAVFFIVGRNSTPGDASPEAGFARDMAVHHAQAVEMSFIVRDATDDEEIRRLAYDIIVTQTAQRGMFMGWLQQWGLTYASSRPAMAWMSGHGHAAAAAPRGGDGSGKMPGMATAEELDRLRAATGKEAEILFLQLMIRHHEGGVEMADGLLALSDREEVVTMARHISNGQAGEIELMTRMLADRGAEPYPSILD